MAKDPAILFYTSDFLSGTLTMDDDQVGKYIKLLCLQHQKGGRLSEKDMLKICGTYDEDVFSKFKQDDEGFYNDRMDQEIQKRIKYSESRRENRMSKKDMSHICKTYDKHMENENVNINEVIDKKRGSGGKKCLMRNSGITIDKLKEYFNGSDIKIADPDYYYNTALAWSDSKGEMRIDWLATIANFARRDLKDGKMRLRPSKSRVEIEKAPDDFGSVSPTALTREQYLKQKNNERN